MNLLGSHMAQVFKLIPAKWFELHSDVQQVLNLPEGIPTLYSRRCHFLIDAKCVFFESTLICERALLTHFFPPFPHHMDFKWQNPCKETLAAGVSRAQETQQWGRQVHSTGHKPLGPSRQPQPVLGGPEQTTSVHPLYLLG